MLSCCHYNNESSALLCALKKQQSYCIYAEPGQHSMDIKTTVSPAPTVTFANCQRIYEKGRFSPIKHTSIH